MLQNACETLVLLVQRSASQGAELLEQLLRFAERLLGPDLECTPAFLKKDDACLYVGPLAMLLFANYGRMLPAQLQVGLLQALVLRLARAERPYLRQELVVVFARLLHEDLNGSLQALAGMEVPAKDAIRGGLELLMSTWLAVAPEIRARRARNVTVSALCRVHERSKEDSQLRSLLGEAATPERLLQAILSGLEFENLRCGQLREAERNQVLEDSDEEDEEADDETRKQNVLLSDFLDLEEIFGDGEVERSHILAWKERLQLQPPTSAYGSSAQWQLALDTLQQLCLEDLELFGLQRYSGKAREMPNVISFSACMNACEKGSRWEMALDLLSQMPEAQIEPNFISFGTALSALSKGEAWKEALQLLCELPERGIETGMISMNAALSACGRASKWQEATALFFKAHRQTLQPSVVSFSAAISACERGSQWESALCLFEDMQSSEITPNTISFSAVISACEKGGHWALALHFLSLTKDADVICYSAAMSACEKGEQWPSALQLLQQMPLRRCAPNTVSYNAAISACENGSCWEEALQLFESMVLRKLQPNVRTFNALISACPGWQMAAGLFGELRRLVLDPTVVSYNALMGRLETDGSAHWDESLRLLEELQEKAILPDVLTFNTAIAVNRQRKPVVNKLLAAMRSKNLVPDVISYNSAISSCQANSDWHDALQFLDEMYLSSVPVDRISYNAVLSCCFAASQWQKVFQLLDAMVAAGMAGFTASRYDHQSQAGSALDCFKHSVLVALLQRFAQDPAPFTYVDTHAGRGIYELAEDGNFRHGITRLVANNTSSFRCGPLAEFLAVQQKLFQGAPPCESPVHGLCLLVFAVLAAT
ncbi:unnamed protein product [Durusdinium trenchii]|uniref:Pentatricopeptide repeat-containing protein, chloroplastic n=1 Tax=Durusdinium trenchii TaxID=1381693 RepID=A0ABP0M8V7_9DINO